MIHILYFHLQTALKEKTEHVEQLLQERDLERSEVARVAARVDEVMPHVEDNVANNLIG